MRLATLIHRGRRRLVNGPDTDGAWRLAPPSATLAGVIADGVLPAGDGDPVDGTDRIDDRGPAGGSGGPVLPYPPATLHGIGLDYRETIAEMGRQTPGEPCLFPKLSSSVIGTGESIVFDTELTRRLDRETELAVVIGTEARHVTEEDAPRDIFGYTVANDISARPPGERRAVGARQGPGHLLPARPPRRHRRRDPRPARAAGPYLGQRRVCPGRQDGTTADMVFRIPELIAYLGRFFTLRPGTWCSPGPRRPAATT